MKFSGRKGVMKGAVVAGLALVTATAALMPAASQAQPVSGGNVRVLVGFPPGGSADLVGRAFAEHLRQATGATVVVDNRPGASGSIANEALLAAPADGSTVALVPSSLLALTPQVMKAVRYDPVRDFVALGSLAEYGFAVAAGPASKAATVEAYKAWATANPAASSFASSGNGTPQHFLGAQFQRLMGIDLVHVPYRGAGAAMSDVLGGQVPILVTTETSLAPHQGKGQLNTLLVTSPKPNPKFPGVKTARELGLADLEAADWFGVFASSRLQADQVKQWREALAKVLARPEFVASMAAMGNTVPASQPEDFTAVLKAEQAAWVRRVQQSGFVPED